jgi:hypothetical protein
MRFAIGMSGNQFSLLGWRFFAARKIGSPSMLELQSRKAALADKNDWIWLLMEMVLYEKNMMY